MNKTREYKKWMKLCLELLTIAYLLCMQFCFEYDLYSFTKVPKIHLNKNAWQLK